MNIRATATRIILTLFLGCALLPGAASAAAYLKIDGVDGESKDRDHDKWIDILSIKEALSVPASTSVDGGRTRASAVLEDIVLSKEIDRTSPTLRDKLARGEVISTVMIELTSTYGEARQTYFKYELRNVLITSVSLSGTADSESVPVEELSLKYEEIKWTYTEYDDAGSKIGDVEAQWNVRTGE